MKYKLKLDILTMSLVTGGLFGAGMGGMLGSILYDISTNETLDNY